jgi:hypothetical protein
MKMFLIRFAIILIIIITVKLIWKITDGESLILILIMWWKSEELTESREQKHDTKI